MTPASAPSRSAILQTAAFLAVTAALLFGSAGEIGIAAFWAYLAVLAVTCGAALLVIDPDLAQERMRPGGKRLGTRYRLLPLLPFAHWAIAGLDRGRFHWSDAVAPSLRLGALILFAAAMGVLTWAMQANRFFSSVARIQSERGHRVIAGGPYRWVRHPGYAAAIVMVLASGIALGSWLAAAAGALGVPLLLWRTIGEDRMLRAGLPGYEDYAAGVRHRLVPGLW